MQSLIKIGHIIGQYPLSSKDQTSPECLFWPVGGHFGFGSHLVFSKITEISPKTHFMHKVACLGEVSLK